MTFMIRRDPLLVTLNHLLSGPDSSEAAEGLSPAARSYVNDTRAQANTAVDVKELPKAYVFVADMPGLKSADIKVQVEDDNVLTIGGERKREQPEEGTKYLLMERGAGKFLRKFALPSNADLEHITASCNDGILVVTVPKVPPPEPKTIDITVG